ncbi:MAG: DEAD/DEAH box helicase [Spirochaetales bacterium]|nr:DEAD/DEAH box helicase [Spirochaetales bacterium]
MENFDITDNGFAEFDLDRRIVNLLDDRDITEPTDIQYEVIPKILNGEDVIAQSKTGTGKTIAYIAPLASRILNCGKVLIITPTKELARQVYEECLYFTEDIGIDTELLVSGESVEKAAGKINTDYDIIVGVPGRILKLVDMGVLKLAEVKKIVVDEIDFLIDMGFKKDLLRIFELTKNHDQVMIFSATLSAETKKMLNLAVNQKFAARVDVQNTLPETITNYLIPMKSPNSDEKEYKRDDILLTILDNINPYLCIIFVRTKKEAAWLYSLLKERGFSVSHLSGDLKSTQRKRQLEQFRNAKVQYLVSTDLASRGIDVEGINYIINYNLPVGELDYLHRAGRTGRAGEDGAVYSICNELDEGYLRKYAMSLGFDILSLKIRKGKLIEDKAYEGVKARLSLGEKAKLTKIQHSEKKAADRVKAHEEWRDNRRKRRPNPNRQTQSGRPSRNNKPPKK